MAQELVDGIIITDAARESLQGMGIEELYQEGLFEAAKLLGFLPNSLDYVRPRAHAISEQGHVNIGDSGSVSVLLHEIGHILEHRESLCGISLSIVDKLKSESTWFRSDDPDIGLELGFIPKNGEADEYMLKVYEDGRTEIISMLLQQFGSPQTMLNLYCRSREQFSFILGVIVATRERAVGQWQESKAHA